MWRHYILLAVAASALVAFIVCAVLQVDFAISANERRAWRTAAVDQISLDNSNPDYSERQLGNMERVRASKKRSDWWATSEFVLLKDGSWLSYRMQESKSEPRKVNMTVIRSSDGTWHLKNTAIHFASKQPDSLRTLIDQHNLIPMDGP